MTASMRGETQWYVLAKFSGSLNPDERQELHWALCAQLEDMHDVEVHLVQDEPTDLSCGACGMLYSPFEEHHCDLAPAPAGEVAPVLGRALLPVLGRVADLAAQCFRMTTWQGEPRWLEFDANEDGMIHSDLGTMRLRDFRAHYMGGEQ